MKDNYSKRYNNLLCFVAISSGIYRLGYGYFFEENMIISLFIQVLVPLGISIYLLYLFVPTKQTKKSSVIWLVLIILLLIALAYTKFIS
ncbi:hypothetical protein JZO70_13345 [Enterococcus sp. 669A]|uniref:Uncharacterized protein n=1 Tax=Candidatus Enterococcus moelleringii TaxID=2815325 RepID=A0ABS3LEI3_9ENTE|nr:hypothetical protein [Enterococcus sp. 669A]MBO1307156.1 hypothetical protein [Enterococcus sp. 669A]